MAIKSIKKIKKKRITSLRRGDKIFLSNGISEIKVTNSNEVICLEIPIKSSGISELIDDFNRNAPTPPIKKELVKPDSKIGNQMGLTRKEWMFLPDLSDKKYQELKQEHDSDLGIAIVLAGLDFPILDEKDKEIEDKNEKITILKEMGMSSTQFTQLVEDITNLTKWEEKEKANFLK